MTYFQPALKPWRRSLTESIEILDGHATSGETPGGEIWLLPSAERRMIRDRDGGPGREQEDDGGLSVFTISRM